MKIWGRILLFGLLLFGLAPQGNAGATGIDDYPHVAVVAFQNKAPVTWDFFGDYAAAAGDYVTFELMRSGRFDMMERGDLQAVLDEHSLNLTGLVDRSTMAEIGKLAGLDFEAMGSITSLTCKRSSGGVGVSDSDFDMNRYKVTATVLLRVVDVTTGRIVLYGRGTAHSDSTKTMVGVNGRRLVHFGADEVSEEQCDSAVKKAVHEAIYGKEGILTELDGKG